MENKFKLGDKVMVTYDWKSKYYTPYQNAVGTIIQIDEDGDYRITTGILTQVEPDGILWVHERHLKLAENGIERALKCLK